LEAVLNGYFLDAFLHFFCKHYIPGKSYDRNVN